MGNSRSAWLFAFRRAMPFALGFIAAFEEHEIRERERERPGGAEGLWMHTYTCMPANKQQDPGHQHQHFKATTRIVVCNLFGWFGTEQFFFLKKKFFSLLLAPRSAEKKAQVTS